MNWDKEISLLFFKIAGKKKFPQVERADALGLLPFFGARPEYRFSRSYFLETAPS